MSNQHSEAHKKLSAELRRKNAIANKRAKRQEAAGHTNTPSYKFYKRTGGKFTTSANDSYQEKQKQLARVNHYLESKTSTIRGAKQVAKKGLGVFNMKSTGTLSADNNKISKMWETVDKVMQAGNLLGLAVSYNEAIGAILSFIKDSGTGVTLDNAQDHMDEILGLIDASNSNQWKEIKDINNEIF